MSAIQASCPFVAMVASAQHLGPPSEGALAGVCVAAPAYRKAMTSAAAGCMTALDAEKFLDDNRLNADPAH